MENERNFIILEILYSIHKLFFSSPNSYPKDWSDSVLVLKQYF